MRFFRSRNSAVAEHPGPSGDGAAGAPSASDEGLAEMSFIEHLEEFRWMILRSLIGIGVAVFATIFFRRWIIDQLLLGPTRSDFFMYRVFGLDAVEIQLLNRTITGQFFADIGTIIAVGLIIGSPVVVYHIWKFIEPGLYASEKAGMRFSAVFATLFFIFGILFGYLIITPLALQFFAGYTISEQILNQFDITRYFSMVTFWAFGTGVLFELPVVIYFLSKLGLITPAVLRKYRRIAVVGILVAGAFSHPARSVVSGYWSPFRCICFTKVRSTFPPL
jgi:sec-independent protein translocase protein TatC